MSQSTANRLKQSLKFQPKLFSEITAKMLVELNGTNSVVSYLVVLLHYEHSGVNFTNILQGAFVVRNAVY